jgi:hypothetical protein
VADRRLTVAGQPAPVAADCRRGRGSGQLRVENLQGDRAVVPEVSREVDRGHTPAPELPLNHVAASKGVS